MGKVGVFLFLLVAVGASVWVINHFNIGGGVAALGTPKAA